MSFPYYDFREIRLDAGILACRYKRNHLFDFVTVLVGRKQQTGKVLTCIQKAGDFLNNRWMMKVLLQNAYRPPGSQSIVHGIEMKVNMRDPDSHGKSYCA